MNFLIDAQLPPNLSKWLISKGYSSRHLMEIEKGLILPDDLIWEIARDCNEIIVTKDSDFSDKAILNTPPPQVLLIKFGNCSNRQLLEYLENQWNFINTSLENGAKLVLVSKSHINVFD